MYIEYFFTIPGREVPHIRGADLPLVSISLEGEPGYGFETIGDVESEGEEPKGDHMNHEVAGGSEATDDRTFEEGVSAEVHDPSLGGGYLWARILRRGRIRGSRG